MCGMTRPDDAALAVLAGADAVGMVLHAGVRRTLTPAAAGEITRRVKSPVMSVGVFVNETLDQVKAAVAQSGVTAVQLHGDEDPVFAAALWPLPVIKALRVDQATLPRAVEAWRAAWTSHELKNWTALLLEAPAQSAEAGGTGQMNDFPLVESLQHAGLFAGLPPLVIAGGLTPENVFSIVHRLRPWGVDVSSGIESTLGRKSSQKMTDFVSAVRAADSL